MTRDEQIQSLGESHAFFVFSIPMIYVGYTELDGGKIQLNYEFETNLTIYDKYKDASGVHRTSIIIHEDDLIEAEEPFTPEEGEYVLEEVSVSAGTESSAIAQYDPAELDKLKKAAINFASMKSGSMKPN
jgi:hypothetical protein